MLQEQILSLFPGAVRQAFAKAPLDWEQLQEIRIRAGQPVILLENGRERILELPISIRDISMLVENACGYSGYAFEEEISRGYVTISGGHRIGLAGRAVLAEGRLQTLKYISAVNIRIAHPVCGCAEPWRSFFYMDGKPCHTLIISPPGHGKTTMLRDAIRMLSNGCDACAGVTVGVVDERSEIAGSYRGMQTHDLGMRTDVLDGCPKVLGMEMLLRSMSPKVIAVDEIGIHDVAAIENALRCGCRILATLHGETIKDFIEKPGFASLVQECVFQRYIFLEQRETPGNVAAIYDRNFKRIFGDMSA